MSHVPWSLYISAVKRSTDDANNYKEMFKVSTLWLAFSALLNVVLLIAWMI
jgi:hypothetical protein